MFDLLLRRARLVDDTVCDIALQSGKIAALGEISAPAVKTPRSPRRLFCQRWLD